MPDQDRPQILLLTEATPDPDGLADRMARVMDAAPVACVRLPIAHLPEDLILRCADPVRELCHARDIPVVLDTHVALVERLGLDGVHLGDGGRGLRKLREGLGADAIIGASCGTSRHDGMSAAEAGADYIAFGPVGDTSLGDGSRADQNLFAWWSEMIEVPVVAEGALSPDLVRMLSPMTDFFAFGEEIWRQDNPAAAMAALARALDG